MNECFSGRSMPTMHSLSRFEQHDAKQKEKETKASRMTHTYRYSNKKKKCRAYVLNAVTISLFRLTKKLFRTVRSSINSQIRLFINIRGYLNSDITEKKKSLNGENGSKQKAWMKLLPKRLRCQASVATTELRFQVNLFSVPNCYNVIQNSFRCKCMRNNASIFISVTVKSGSKIV